MNGEKYIIHCPRCGIVEASVYDNIDDSSEVPGEGDIELEEEVWETTHGPESRIRCPRCGAWLASDLAHPED